jgi:hypothetical protein
MDLPWWFAELAAVFSGLPSTKFLCFRFHGKRGVGKQGQQKRGTTSWNFWHCNIINYLQIQCNVRHSIGKCIGICIQLKVAILNVLNWMLHHFHAMNINYVVSNHLEFQVFNDRCLHKISDSLLRNIILKYWHNITKSLSTSQVNKNYTLFFWTLLKSVNYLASFTTQKNVIIVYHLTLCVECVYSLISTNTSRMHL